MENIKYIKFLENTSKLNNKFGIVPVLYGSLALEVLTDESLNSDDIDILIPEIYIKGNRWSEFKEYQESQGYILIDEHEHTFEKENIHYSYATIEHLKSFAGIDISEISSYEEGTSKFKIPTLEQFLIVYQQSLLDEYRVNVFKKKQKDQDKIEFIKKSIKSRKTLTKKIDKT